jgi:putative phosphoribosyl transferase
MFPSAHGFVLAARAGSASLGAVDEKSGRPSAPPDRGNDTASFLRDCAFAHRAGHGAMGARLSGRAAPACNQCGARRNSRALAGTVDGTLLAPLDKSMLPEDPSGSDGHAVVLRIGNAQLAGALVVPSRPLGVVLFVDVSGSTSCSPSHLFLARALGEAGLAALVLNLLTRSEAAADARTAWLRNDVALLAGRIGAALRWLAARPETADLPVGLFASDVAAQAALAAAASEPALAAVVCCTDGAAHGGMENVRPPTVLIGGAARGDLQAVATEAARWFSERLVGQWAAATAP